MKVDFKRNRVLASFVFMALFMATGCGAATAYPLEFRDSTGSKIVIPARPERVVSLVPGHTQIIQSLGAGDAIVGVTLHDDFLSENAEVKIVGGFRSPSVRRIEEVHPDLILLSSLHGEVREHFTGRECLLVELKVDSFRGLYETIELLGRVFGKEARAAEIVESLKEELALVSRKLKPIPADRRKRVVRIMGSDPQTVPGDDSFQNELIRAAGGVPPKLGKAGGAVEMSLDEWRKFNPQVITTCGGKESLMAGLLSREGWKDVDAVLNGRILDFPCNLICRASVRSGQLVSYLASTLYEEHFSEPEKLAGDRRRTATRSIDIPLDYVQDARVVEHMLFDFVNKTLVVDFRAPMRVLSTLEGDRRGLLSVGNHYSPPPCWSIGHRIGLEEWRKHVHRGIGKSMQGCSLLVTGADMDNLAVARAEHGDLAVHALVTAGVVSNAVRMSRDEGRYIEPGTINIILMTNRRLTPRAMARLVISATEAKTAALQDLDVRSSQEPARWQATGTGTDEIIVVEGRGRRIDNAGGHCKVGELAARAVHEGVTEAVRLQNGLTRKRHIFRRLQERRIDLHGLLGQCACTRGSEDLRERLATLEDLLLQPRCAAFLEAALALSDAHERGLVSNLEPFALWCRGMAGEIGGKEITHWAEPIQDEALPAALRMALNALLNGAAARQEENRSRFDGGASLGWEAADHPVGSRTDGPPPPEGPAKGLN